MTYSTCKYWITKPTTGSTKVNALDLEEAEWELQQRKFQDKLDYQAEIDLEPEFDFEKDCGARP